MSLRHALFAAALLPSAAAAQFLPFHSLGDRATATELRAGAAVLSLPEYAGSDERRWLAVPTFDAKFANGVFVSVVQGVGVDFSRTAGRQWGLRVGPDLGRDAEGRLDGLGDIPARVRYGAFFNQRFATDWVFLSSLRAGSGREREGMVVDVGLSRSLALPRPWFASAGVALQWANGAQTREFFGVTAQQSAASRTGLPAYATSSGLSEASVGVSAGYVLGPRTTLVGVLGVARLLGDAADSPVVQTRHPAFGLVGITWRL